MDAPNLVVIPADALISTPMGLLLAHTRLTALARGEGVADLRSRTELGLEAACLPAQLVLVMSKDGIARKKVAAVALGDRLLASFGRDVHGDELELGVGNFSAVTSAKASFCVDELDEMTARMLGYVVSECCKRRAGTSYTVALGQSCAGPRLLLIYGGLP